MEIIIYKSFSYYFFAYTGFRIHQNINFVLLACRFRKTIETNRNLQFTSKDTFKLMGLLKLYIMMIYDPLVCFYRYYKDSEISI